MEQLFSSTIFLAHSSTWELLGHSGKKTIEYGLQTAVGKRAGQAKGIAWQPHHDANILSANQQLRCLFLWLRANDAVEITEIAEKSNSEDIFKNCCAIQLSAKLN